MPWLQYLTPDQDGERWCSIPRPLSMILVSPSQMLLACRPEFPYVRGRVRKEPPAYFRAAQSFCKCRL
jgi:hypothetical protein